MASKQRKLAPDDHSWDYYEGEWGSLPNNFDPYILKCEEWQERDWIPWLREQLSFPFEVERIKDDGDAFFARLRRHEPARIGNKMKATDILDEEMAFHGIIVKVLVGRCTRHISLCDVEVSDASDPNFWPVREYAAWSISKGFSKRFRNDSWEKNDSIEKLLTLDKRALIGALLDMAIHSKEADTILKRLIHNARKLALTDGSMGKTS